MESSYLIFWLFIGALVALAAFSFFYPKGTKPSMPESPIIEPQKPINKQQKQDTPLSESLPDSFLQKKHIQTLPVGQKVYVTPWSVNIDESRNGFIKPSITYDHKRFGTFDLPIEKDVDGNIIAYVSEMNKNYEWEPHPEINKRASKKVLFK